MNKRLMQRKEMCLFQRAFWVRPELSDSLEPPLSYCLTAFMAWEGCWEMYLTQPRSTFPSPVGNVSRGEEAPAHYHHYFKVGTASTGFMEGKWRMRGVGYPPQTLWLCSFSLFLFSLAAQASALILIADFLSLTCRLTAEKIGRQHHL